MAKGNEILLEILLENKQLRSKIDESNKKITELENKTKKSGESTGNIFQKIGGFIAGYFSVKVVGMITKLAGEIDSVSESFYSLAAGAKGGAEGLLEAMKKASKGTVDETAIMKGSNQAISVLGQQAADSLPKLMQIALESAKKTGKSTEEAFNELIQGVSIGSTRALTQVGISGAKIATSVEAYAQSLGKTTSQLSETEKKQAFLNAVLKAGDSVLNKAGAGTLSFGQKLQVLKVRIGDIADSAATILTPALENVLDMLLSIGQDSTGESLLSFSSWFKGLGLYLNSVAMKIEELKLYWQEFTTGLYVSGQAIGQLAKTGDFAKFFHDMKLGLTANRILAEQNIDALIKKYADLNTQTMEGGKKRLKNEKNNQDLETEAVVKGMENRAKLYNEGQYLYEYTDQFIKAELSKEEEKYQQMMQMEEKFQMELTAVKDSYRLNEQLLAQTENEQKAMALQAEIDLEKARYETLLQLQKSYKERYEAMSAAYDTKRQLAEVNGKKTKAKSDEQYLKLKLGMLSLEWEATKEITQYSTTLMSSHNKVLFGLGKALAYANAVMAAAEGVARVWGQWGAYPPVAAAFSAIVLAATGVEIMKIKNTKLPSYHKGRIPVFADGYTPADHFPAMIGAKEAVINERSTIANAGLLKSINESGGKSISTGNTVVVNQNNNISGNVLSKDFVADHVIPHLEEQARYAGKQLFAEK